MSRAVFPACSLPPELEVSKEQHSPKRHCPRLLFTPQLHTPFIFFFPQSFARIKKWIEHAKKSPNLTILAGGGCDDSVGYFIEPCIVESKDPKDPIMKEVRVGKSWDVALHLGA